MKGAPVFPDEGETAETERPGREDTGTQDLDQETEIFPKRRDSDSTIGLPERVSQAPLPFEPAAAEEEPAEEEEPEEGTRATLQAPDARPEQEPPAPPALRPAGRSPLETFEEVEETLPGPPFSFAVFFKSKAFDVLFVGLFWLVGLWLAAHALDMTLFGVLASASGTMFLLYVALVFIYFFLFKFFLGETLGDRLFKEREKP